MQIIVSRSARRELKTVYDYIAQENKSAAEKVILTLEAKFKILARRPQMYAVQAKYKNLRKATVGNYLVFYKENQKAIYVVRVIHASRDIEAALVAVH